MPWFDSRSVFDDNIIMRYVRADHCPDIIPLLALDCDGFRSHMCVVRTKLNDPKFGPKLAPKRFVHDCGVH